jgi:glutaredoxin 3
MATSGEEHSAPNVTIYATPACHWCDVAKRYLANHDIAYREIDITRDRQGLRDMVVMTGGRSVPVLLVGNHAMIGWDVNEFEKLRSGRFKRR